MIFTETKLKGAFVVDINRLEDERGFFARSYCKTEFEAHALNTNLVQSNVSFNKISGTLRGMHMQNEPHAETKLVRCTSGSIFDVIVDLRPESNTFKEWIGVELSAENYRMLYVPEGFAHGFLTLEDCTAVAYQVTQFYHNTAERAYRWDDPAFGISWPFKPVLVSEKDKAHARFDERVLAWGSQ
ncbi:MULTISPECIES: dTDP-4-dehydrorhamnose 3,5-epimerase [unclassified Mucilaginibacter]|uniref:dTDP-4-dehydrorhamnose 3,5-epimerase n=1 Tax=unclassified Mucilaginibacter TaxID=2617802 RepID=UPI0031F62585